MATNTNGVKFTTGEAETLGHVNADIWGVYVFGLPVISGSSVEPGKCVVFSDTVDTSNAISFLTHNTQRKLNASVITDVTTERTTGWLVPTVFFFGSALSYALVAWTAGSFQRWMGLVYLAVFVVYMVVSTVHMKKHPELAEEDEEGESDGKPRGFSMELLLLVIGAAAIAVGARLLVDNGTKIAAALGVPDSVIGLTMVALGTSLPELITAITSLVKGHGSLSLGNIIGANLFNIILVSGMSISLSPFSIPAEKTLPGGLNSSLVIDLPLMLIVMSILCLPALFKGRLKRWQGILLLAVYAAFTVYQFAA